jgi:hypothetical protein
MKMPTTNTSAMDHLLMERTKPVQRVLRLGLLHAQHDEGEHRLDERHHDAEQQDQCRHELIAGVVEALHALHDALRLAKDLAREAHERNVGRDGENRLREPGHEQAERDRR